MCCQTRPNIVWSVEFLVRYQAVIHPALNDGSEM